MYYIWWQISREKDLSIEWWNIRSKPRIALKYEKYLTKRSKTFCIEHSFAVAKESRAKPDFNKWNTTNLKTEKAHSKRSGKYRQKPCFSRSTKTCNCMAINSHSHILTRSLVLFLSLSCWGSRSHSGLTLTRENSSRSRGHFSRHARTITQTTITTNIVLSLV